MICKDCGRDFITLNKGYCDTCAAFNMTPKINMPKDNMAAKWKNSSISSLQKILKDCSGTNYKNCG